MIKLRLFICLGIAATTQASLSASINASDLLSNSPFVHARIIPGQGANGETAQQYVFHGVCKLGDDVLINISDNVKKKAYWIKTGETQNDINVVSYDAELKKVSILVGSRDYTLDLSKPKVQTTARQALDPNRNNMPGNGNNNQLRIHRAKRPRPVPPLPPSVNFNDPDFQNFLHRNNISPNEGMAIANSESVRTRYASVNSSSSNGTNDNSSDVAAANVNNAGYSSTPPSSIPSSPPNYIPEMPESVKLMIESNAAPGSNNRSN